VAAEQCGRGLRIPFHLYLQDAASQERWMRHFMAFLNPLGPRNLPGAYVYAADNLITLNRNTGFLSDQHFLDAVMSASPTLQEQSCLWRTHTLAWAAKSCAGLAGDFVECGTYRGYSAHVVMNYLGWNTLSKRYFLYDLFDPAGTAGEGERLPDHSPRLYEEVCARYAGFQGVNVIRGKVPDSFAQACPERIAFLHLDLNNAQAESAALEYLFERLVPGAILILDDYGWATYADQQAAADAFAASRNHAILELPTGQGMLIKR
jgi:predicted O-methyltransferase YrrM